MSDWHQLLSAMTPAEMEREYTELCDRQGKGSKLLGDLRRRVEAVKAEEHAIQKRIYDLREAYRTKTGNTIKRGVDADVIHTAENAVKALINAVCAPLSLPLDCSEVREKLAELRDAINARRAAKGAKGDS